MLAPTEDWVRDDDDGIGSEGGGEVICRILPGHGIPNGYPLSVVDDDEPEADVVATDEKLELDVFQGSPSPVKKEPIASVLEEETHAMEDDDDEGDRSEAAWKGEL